MKVHNLDLNTWIQCPKNLRIGRFSSPYFEDLTFSPGTITIIYILHGEVLISPILRKLQQDDLAKLNNPSNQTLKSTDSEAEIIIFTFPDAKSDRDVSIKSGESQPEINKISLNVPKHINHWTVGYGSLPIKTADFSLVQIIFHNEEEFESILKPREVYHNHEYGFEYYLVLEGSNLVKVKEEIITVSKHQILEVPTGVCHLCVGLEFPMRGLNFRYPSLDGDKELC